MPWGVGTHLGSACWCLCPGSARSPGLLLHHPLGAVVLRLLRAESSFWTRSCPAPCPAASQRAVLVAQRGARCPGGATPCLGAVPCSPLPCSAAAGAAQGMLLAKVWLSTRSLQCCAPRSWRAMHPALGCAAHPISPGCTPYPCCAPQGAEHPSGGMPRRTGCVPPGFGARKCAQSAARHLWAHLDHGAGPMEHRGVTWAPYLPFQYLPAVSPHGALAGGAPIVLQEGSGRWDRTRGQGGVGKPWWGQPRLPAAPSAPGGPLVGEGGPGGCSGFVCAAAGGFRPFFVHSSPWRWKLPGLGTSLSPARQPALPRSLTIYRLN